MTGASTERQAIRKKALQIRYLGFNSSTANSAKAMMSVSIPAPRTKTGKKRLW